MILTALAKKCNCDVMTVRRWVRANNCVTTLESCGNNKTAKAISEQNCLEFESWWNKRFEKQEGISIKNLAKESGVDYKTVILWCKKNNIKLSKLFLGNGPATHFIGNEDADKFKQIYHNKNEAIPLSDLLKKYKSSWHSANKWAKRENKNFVKMIGGGKGLVPNDAKLFEKYLKSIKEGGYLYLIQLLPECSPDRIKFGFAYVIERRIASHRITCPNAKLLGSWPCLRHDEKETIRQITGQIKCTKLTSEVFDCDNYVQALTATNNYFKDQYE